jgi:hypothetical protein
VTRIVAHVVDPIAVAKVRNQVYRGFSIGGRVTKRAPGDPKTITGLVLNEISLVDRPANPEAVFDCWKAAEGVGGRSPAAAPTGEPFNPPIQIWACGMPDHDHRAKNDAIRCLQKRALTPENSGASQQGQVNVGDTCGAEATIDAARKAIETAEGALVKADGREATEISSKVPQPDDAITYADPGYQPDGKRRYPLDSERYIRAAWSYINQPKNAARYKPDQLKRVRDKIIAAWKVTIDADGPPSAEDDEKASCASLTKGALGRRPHRADRFGARLASRCARNRGIDGGRRLATVRSATGDYCRAVQLSEHAGC